MRFWTDTDLAKVEHTVIICADVHRRECEKGKNCFRFRDCHPIEITKPAEEPNCRDQSEQGGKCGMEFAYLRKEIVALGEQHDGFLKRFDVFVDQFAKLAKRKAVCGKAERK